MLISEAWAQAAGGSGGMAGIEQFLPLILIFVVFYFLMIRPQQAKAKRHKMMVSNLRRGDRVVSQGGLLGTVSKVINDGELQVEIAEGVRVRLLRNAVTEVLAKTEPASASASSKEGGAKDRPANDDSTAEGSDDDAPSLAPPAPPPPTGLAAVIARLFGGK